ncbi:hypothetical protein [Cellulomonas sp. S1-8]|uniref:hypothetical protein n=1 Tax=Cellulomonas sp. S1-8 TaxID=2904790 RepID=UPI0022439F35|nr:hypothetical protein [Cellulomonas sp. S1-8]UZN01809.1 hypothetical protein OKX07_11960 [Cellulomonas sp. S1-8]
MTVVGAGAAFAYWTATGTGDGTATTGESTDFVVVVDSASATGEIVPGGAGMTVPFTVTNNADGPQELSLVEATAADALGVAWVPPAGCLVGDYVVTVDQGLIGSVPGDGGVVNGEVLVTLTDTGVDQDACQGAVVPLHVVAS